jgi:pimeloyl-ACP methyl ester carboxylesterase
MCRTSPYAVIGLGVALAAMTATLSAQPEDVRGRIAEVLRYSGIENAAPDDVGRMADLWSRAQQPGLAGDERRLAFRDMYVLYAKLHGRDLASRPQALDRVAQFAASTLDGGGRMDLSLPEPRGAPSGSYLHVESRGHGPIQLLLISDLGIDGLKLYDSFVQRRGAAYTMRIVTLPFAGRARPLPWPEKLDHARRPWVSQIERELLTLVDQPHMKGVTIVGTAAGGYFAARLALLRPKQVRSVVLVNALVNVSMRAVNEPDAPAPMTQRLLFMKSVAPTPQLFPVAPLPPPEVLRRLIADQNSSHPTARNWMAFAVKDAAVSRAWTFDALTGGFFVPSLEYRWELTTTDLTEEMKELAVPLLVLGSWHDEGSPAGNTPTISQWEELKLLYPKIPLNVAAFDDTRHYISADAPEEFDLAIADFLAGRRVHGKTGYTLPRTSPRASVMQAVGGAEIAIAYGRPAVKGRRIWGELVPNGRVWRAGANEATTFSVNRDIRIDGNALAAGSYTFFAIPGDAEWTMIFNRVPRQWGAFDYNPAFDALRVAVRPAEAPHEESLRYTIQPVGPSGAIATLAWEKRALSFRIDVSP